MKMRVICTIIFHKLNIIVRTSTLIFSWSKGIYHDNDNRLVCECNVGL